MTTPPMNNFNSTQSWPAGAIEDWQQGASYAWIASKYGRGYSTVAKMIRSVKMLGSKRVVDVAARKRHGGRKPLHEQKPIGPDHLHVGLWIGRFREIENDFTCSEFAAMINTNRISARMMELGLHDFTLSELRKIAQILSVSLAELIGPGSTYGFGRRTEEMSRTLGREEF